MEIEEALTLKKGDKIVGPFSDIREIVDCKVVKSTNTLHWNQPNEEYEGDYRHCYGLTNIVIVSRSTPPEPKFKIFN